MASSLGRTIVAASMTALAAWATSRLVEAWVGTETLASQAALVFLPSPWVWPCFCSARSSSGSRRSIP